LNPGSRRRFFDLPGRYRIHIYGQLSASLADRLGDLTITARHAADQQQVTTLTGELTDQAALLGVLNTLYDMGFPLLKVERLRSPSSAEDPSH
jgi:hypothetical protein